MVIIYMLCKHNKLRALVMRLALQQVKEVKAEEIRDENYKCKCTSQFYTFLAVSIVSNNRFSCICNLTGWKNKIM